MKRDDIYVYLKKKGIKKEKCKKIIQSIENLASVRYHYDICAVDAERDFFP